MTQIQPKLGKLKLEVSVEHIPQSYDDSSIGLHIKLNDKLVDFLMLQKKSTIECMLLIIQTDQLKIQIQDQDTQEELGIIKVDCQEYFNSDQPVIQIKKSYRTEANISLKINYDLEWVNKFSKEAKKNIQLYQQQKIEEQKYESSPQRDSPKKKSTTFKSDATLPKTPRQPIADQLDLQSDLSPSPYKKPINSFQDTVKFTKSPPKNESPQKSLQQLDILMQSNAESFVVTKSPTKSHFRNEVVIYPEEEIKDTTNDRRQSRKNRASMRQSQMNSSSATGIIVGDKFQVKGSVVNVDPFGRQQQSISKLQDKMQFSFQQSISEITNQYQSFGQNSPEKEIQRYKSKQFDLQKSLVDIDLQRKFEFENNPSEKLSIQQRNELITYYDTIYKKYQNYLEESESIRVQQSMVINNYEFANQKLNDQLVEYQQKEKNFKTEIAKIRGDFQKLEDENENLLNKLRSYTKLNIEEIQLENGHLNEVIRQKDFKIEEQKELYLTEKTAFQQLKLDFEIQNSQQQILIDQQQQELVILRQKQQLMEDIQKNQGFEQLNSQQQREKNKQLVAKIDEQEQQIFVLEDHQRLLESNKEDLKKQLNDQTASFKKQTEGLNMEIYNFRETIKEIIRNNKIQQKNNDINQEVDTLDQELNQVLISLLNQSISSLIFRNLALQKENYQLFEKIPKTQIVDEFVFKSYTKENMTLQKSRNTTSRTPTKIKPSTPKIPQQNIATNYSSEEEKQIDKAVKDYNRKNQLQQISKKDGEYWLMGKVILIRYINEKILIRVSAGFISIQEYIQQAKQPKDNLNNLEKQYLTFGSSAKKATQ